MEAEWALYYSYLHKSSEIFHNVEGKQIPVYFTWISIIASELIFLFIDIAASKPSSCLSLWKLSLD